MEFQKTWLSLTGASLDKNVPCSGTEDVSRLKKTWLTDIKKITGSSEELLAIFCKCICLQYVDENRASKQASILWAAQGRTSGHKPAARWVS